MHNNKMSILDLPTEILGAEVFSWMDAKSVALFDSAVTSTIWRECFLQSYTYLSPHCVRRLSLTVTALKMSWLSKRNIQLSSIAFAKRLSKFDIESIIISALNTTIPLEHVQFNGNKEVRDTNLFTLAYKCKTLKTIDLWNCEQVTDLGMIRLAECCPELTSVSLWQVNSCRLLWTTRPKISDFTIIALVTNCPRLVHLNLAGCCKTLTDRSIYALSGSQHLESLDLSWAPDHLFSDAALLSLALSCPTLTTLKLHGRFHTTCMLMIDDVLRREPEG